MSDIPGDLNYTESHEWIRKDESGGITVGITDHAQASLGELVFVEVPEVGSELSAGDACAVVESVKAASDVYSPVEGVVTEVNEALADQPELVNEQPYDNGWIMRLEQVNEDDLAKLLDAEAYQAAVEDE
ncbi:MAG: glycine cleavage system protein GcvH [Gammaproteobacteria bacterium]|nr:glycine cleavage system protein GcvH [Gammaproteobacteria bacterium]NNF60069.1 glycine cleavage system protein GcvH [Gammaproteobacteria bacterium]NNM21148.1 glycine cleavage system protein GcvH [Gammaproteobacteria bacterium]